MDVTSINAGWYKSNSVQVLSLTMLDYHLNADDNWTLGLRDFANLAKDLLA